MKKNLFYSLMALFVVLFASCGQEEIVSDNGTEINAPVTISVQALSLIHISEPTRH